MKQIVAVLLLVAMASFFVPQEAKARSNDALVVLKSSVYGGLTGALIGTAFLAFRDQPSEHTKDIRVGAGVGVIVGAFYGLAKTTGVLVQVDDGIVTVQVPHILFDIDRDTHDLKGSVGLLNISF